MAIALSVKEDSIDYSKISIGFHLFYWLMIAIASVMFCQSNLTTTEILEA